MGNVVGINDVGITITDNTTAADNNINNSGVSGRYSVNSSTAAADSTTINDILSNSSILLQNRTNPSIKPGWTQQRMMRRLLESVRDSTNDVENIIKAAAELVQNVTKPPVVVPDTTIENVIKAAAELVQQLTKVPSKSPSERLKDWLDSMYNSEDRSTLYVDYTVNDNNTVTNEYNANNGYKINNASNFTPWVQLP